MSPLGLGEWKCHSDKLEMLEKGLAGGGVGRSKMVHVNTGRGDGERITRTQQPAGGQAVWPAESGGSEAPMPRFTDGCL